MAIPVSPFEIASATFAAVAVGAAAVHVHPRDATGADTLDAAIVGEVVEAIGAVSPTTPIGVATGRG